MNLQAAGIFQWKKINVDVQNVSLAAVLQHIEKETGCNIAYINSVVDKYKGITVKLSNSTVQDILNDALKNTNLKYSIENSTITIMQKVASEKQQKPQQKVTVKGKIIDAETRKPIPGATVLLIGTTSGAISDEKGDFVIKADVGQEMEITYVGMKSIIKKVTATMTDLTITMDKDAMAVDDVIVTGYQEISKTRMTGSAESITSKDIANKGYSSVEDILKGQMAGVATMNISGRPGAQAQIRIRGINSLTGSSDPIWIVDGMPLQGDVPKISMGGTEFEESVLTSGIGNISPDDIESITVLKDAAATAIYGSRAANGVIVIKTKRGAVGKSYLSIQSSYNVSEAPTNRLQMMNTDQKIDFERGIYNDFPGLNLGGRVQQILRNVDKGIFSKAAGEAEIDKLRKNDTNWFDEIFRIAQSQTHSATLSGGSETTQFYANLAYSSQQGVMPNNKYETFGANLKLTHDFNKWLRINFDVRSSLRNDRSSASTVNPLEYATFANPYERPYDDNGNYEYDRSSYPKLSTVRDGYKYDFNMIKDLNENNNNSRYISNQINLKLEATIMKGLMFSTMGTFSTSSNHTMKEFVPGSYSSKANSWLGDFYDEKEIPDYLNNGKLSETTSRSLGWTIRNQFEFARGFSDETHYVNVLLGQEVSSNMGYGFASMVPEWSDVYGVASYPDLNGMKINSNLNISSLGSHNETQDRSVSFFVTGSYSFKDRYVASGSARLDGADIIGTKNRFAPLWNVSGKWNIHNEKFMSSVKVFNQLAIRASYGYTGSIDRNALPFSVLRKVDNYTYDGVPIRDRYDPSNPSIKWQRKRDFNIGMDVSMLTNRINLTVNYYDNVTKNLIDKETVAASTGRQEVTANVASLTNTGWEISLRTLNVKTKDFSWTTSFNFTQNKNMVTDTYYKDLTDFPVTNASADASYNMYIQGQSVSSFYGFRYAGVDPLTGGTLAYIDGFDDNGKRLGSLNSEGRYVYNMDQGDTYTTQMVNAARVYLGESYPPITGGFSTQFNYKRFSLSANFTFMTGHYIKSFQSFNDSDDYTVYASQRNVLPVEANRWRNPGDMTNIPGYSTSRIEYIYQVMDAKFEKGRFLKCNNISLGYNVPQELCEKLKISSVRLNFNMSNVFTLTNYRGIDPETMGSFTYPSARKYNISISIGI